MTAADVTGFFGRGVNYSAANEDGRSELRAFSFRGDERVLCIAGGGERVLDLLTGEVAPREIVAVDANPKQVHVAELKVAALRRLPTAEAFSTVGLTTGDRAARLRALRTLASAISDACASYFAGEGARALGNGLLYAGQFERFAGVMALAVRTAMGGRFRSFFASRDLEEQRAYVGRAIDGPRWDTLLDGQRIARRAVR